MFSFISIAVIDLSIMNNEYNQNGLWNLFFAWDPDENNNKEKYEEINTIFFMAHYFFHLIKLSLD